jgi:hypothetical protein
VTARSVNRGWSGCVGHELVSAPAVFPILRPAGLVLRCNSATYLSFVALTWGVAALRNTFLQNRLHRTAASQVETLPKKGVLH